MSNRAFITPSEIGRAPLRGFIGQTYGECEVLDCVPNDTIQAEIWTVTVNTSATETLTLTYSETNGYSKSLNYDNVSSLSTTEAATALAAAWNADADLLPRAIASSSSNVVTFTGTPGLEFTIAESEANLTSLTNSQNAASAAPIEFGIALCQPPTSPVAETGNLKVFRPVTTAFTAQVQTITVVSAASGVFSGWVRVAGLNSNAICTWGPVLHNTDTSTTAAAIVAAVNTALDAHFGAGYSCLAANTAGAITFTADIAGLEFDAAIIADGSASATAAKVLTTGPSVATSAIRAFRGVSKRTAAAMNQTMTGDDPAYQWGDVVPVVTKGRISVEYLTTGTAPTPGAQVFVSLASATRGDFLVDQSTSAVPLPASVARWELGERTDTLGTDAAGVAILRINADIN